MHPVRRLLDPLLNLAFAAPLASPGFGPHAAGWWEADGPVAPLHRLNPVRLAYLKDAICAASGRDPRQAAPLMGLGILDIGCGGGLVTEPLARLGAAVTGLDASPELIAVARDHAANSGLDIAYRADLSDVLVAEQKTYDVVLALEVIEHVDDPDILLADINALLRPDGVAILSTLNRTPPSWAKGIIAAEYVLRWVTVGTHDWRRFLKPSELARRAQDAALRPTATMGLHYDVLRREFALRADRLEVNYFMVLRHA